jgi:hypothetical protein
MGFANNAISPSWFDTDEEFEEFLKRLVKLNGTENESEVKNED